MPKSVVKRKDTRVRISRFGCVSALLFNELGGSAEIALAPLEMSRLLRVWEEAEAGRKVPDERVLTALRLLIPKARTLAPRIVAEVPIASTKRVTLTPDFEQNGIKAE